MSARAALVLAALLLFAAVALGAFGAHALKARVAPEALAWWHTGVQYHAWHALGLIGAGVLLAVRPHPALAVAGALFVVGIALFSGSLYAMALTGARALGAVTPVGGVALLAGWLAFAWGAWRAG